MSEDYKTKYEELIKYVGYRDAVIKETIKETLSKISPDIAEHRRYQSGQINEIVSLLLDFLVDQQKINLQLHTDLQHEKHRAIVWEEACAELAKENEE